MRLAWEFFKRDALIALSYRVSFGLEVLQALALLIFCLFLGRWVGAGDLPALEQYGGSYLAFLLIGIALTDCTGVSLVAFARQIREGQLTGVLEAILMSPVRLPVILIYSSLWAYFFSGMRFLVYLVLGSFLFGVSLGNASLGTALVIFLLTVLCFAGIGMLWASVVVLIKRGEQVPVLLGYGVILVSGVAYPVESMDPWLQRIAAVVPLTHALEAMRFALLKGRDLLDLMPLVITLSAFAVALLTAAMLSFSLSVRIAKRTGSLTQY